MPAIVITANVGPRRPGARHPKAVLVDDAGRRFEFPFMPREVDYAGGYPTYVQLRRPGTLKPLLKRAGTNLRTMSLDALIARPDHQASVEDLLGQLGAIVRGGQRVTFSAGPAAAGAWHIDGDSVTTRTELLRQGDNAITRAVVSFTLVEASDRAGTAPAYGATRPRTYRLAAGDTLAALALRFYGTMTKWTILADANGIRRAADLVIGDVIKVPK